MRLAAAIAVVGLAGRVLPAQTPQPQDSSTIQQSNEDLARGDYAGALKLLTVLSARTPNNPEILYDLGLALEALHPENAAQPEAEADYRAAIAANPQFALPHVALGLMLARSNRPAEAHGELQTVSAIKDAPTQLKARALRALARLDLQAGHAAAASAELASALQMSSEAPADTLFAAEIAEATPDLAAPEQAYRRYLESNPNDAAATAALAHVLVREHRTAEAEALLTQALTAQPGQPALTAQLANSLLTSGDPAKIAQAAPLLEKLHAAMPDETTVSRLLARVYLETGHPEQADVLYAALLKLPGADKDSTLLTDRAEVLLRLHRPAEAERLLKQAVANRDGFPAATDFAEAAMRLAFAALEIDDPKGCLQALELRATVLQPSLASLFLEATARDALHQSSQAADLYRKFLAEAHGTLPEQERKARERLATLGGRR